MPNIISGGESRGVQEGAPIKEACKELGIPFGCENGLCGTCYVEIVSGMENLSERTEAEAQMGIDEKHRLCCQCKIKKGDVEIKY